MKLQNIIFPSVKNCMEEELYFRNEKDTRYILAENHLILNAGVKVSFDTYFNSFSVGKWFKYTKIDNVCLKIKIRGKFRITLMYLEKLPVDVYTKAINVLHCDTRGLDEDIELRYDFEKNQGSYAFEITALEDGGIFYGGAYHTDISEEEIRKVKIGIVICTYRRERFIYKNMEILNESFFNNPESDMTENICVYISDNAKTLDALKINSSKIKVLPNKNVGGSGGFTRGLIECLKDKEKNGITHALLMDDDIVIQPESIFRTYSMLTLLKLEYKNSFIGGAMLRLDKPWFQTESGALWNTGFLKCRKAGLDLREAENCLYNEIEEACDYNAWWYCAMPMEIVREDNLPIPIFIRGDDVEYGLRNTRNLILMNGICVWHEPFEYKFSSSMYYYIFRNRLIDNSIHSITYPRKQFLRDLRSQVLRELFMYRYKNAELLLEGANDFLKGINWLKAQDGEQLNSNVMQKGYQMRPVNELEVRFDLMQYEHTINRMEGKIYRLLRQILLNGMFMKTKGDAIVPTVDPHVLYFFRKERVLNYDFSSQKGFVTRRDNKEFLRLFKEYRRLRKICSMKYDQVVSEYRQRSNELMNIEFWHKYLDL